MSKQIKVHLLTVKLNVNQDQFIYGEFVVIVS